MCGARGSFRRSGYRGDARTRGRGLRRGRRWKHQAGAGGARVQAAADLVRRVRIRRFARRPVMPGMRVMIRRRLRRQTIMMLTRAYAECPAGKGEVHGGEERAAEADTQGANHGI